MREHALPPAALAGVGKRNKASNSAWSEKHLGNGDYIGMMEKIKWKLQELWGLHRDYMGII